MYPTEHTPSAVAFRCLLIATIAGVSIVVGTGAAIKTRKLPEKTRSDKMPAKSTTRALDDLLLKDLDLRTVVPKQPEKEAMPPDPTRGRAGEDVQPGAGGELTIIGQKMREVQQRLSRRDTSDATQATQQVIVRDLDRLIEQMRKKCGGSSACSSKRSKPGSGKKSASKAGRRAAQDSTNRLSRAREPAVQLETVRQVLGEFWGHLPPRFRRQVQNVQEIEFLPQYRELIEEYYKRLAEEPGIGP